MRTRARGIARGIRRRSLALGRRLDPRPARVLFAFLGTGGWGGAGDSLYRQHPGFRAAIDRSSQLVESLLGFSPAKAMRGEWEPGSFIQGRELKIVSAVLVPLALCDMWREAGVRPAGVLGVSLGEATAAYAAGAIGRDDAIRIACGCARSLSHDPTVQHYLIASPRVPGDVGWWRDAPRPLRRMGRIAPGVDVLIARSAEAEANAAFLQEHARIDARWSAAWLYHVPELEVDERIFREMAAEVVAADARCPIYAASSGGRLASATRFDADYFLWNFRAPIALDGALAAASADGYDTVLNVGPRGIAAWLEVGLRGQALPLINSFEPGPDAAAGWRQAVRQVRALRPPLRPGPKARSEEDPIARYRRWATEGPIRQLSGGGWVALDEGLIREALSRPEDFSTAPYHFFDTHLLGADGEGHAAARGALARHFFRERIAHAVAAAERCARLPRPLRFNAVSDVAVPIAQASAAAFVGVGEADAATLARIAGRRWPGAPDFAAIAAAGDIFAESDLAGALRRQGLASGNAAALARTAWIAALMSTERSVGWSLLYLLSDPALRRAVAGNPERLRRFADEVIRLHPAELVLPRRVERAAMLGGVAIPAGATLHLAVVAANRDPAIYPHPDRIDLDRPARAHLSFGANAHACLGAAMARSVVGGAVGALLAAMPNLRLVQPPASIAYHRTPADFSPEGLAVEQ